VESEVGRGTTFTVRLPLGRSHLKDEEVVEMATLPEMTLPPIEQTRVPQADDQGKARADGQKPVILIIEDNADVRHYIKDNLPTTYQIIEAIDGVEGIERAKESIPDLVISDIMMPKKDGYEVCRDLKNDEKTSHIPIILLTAKAASENKIEGLETGADDYLIKPFEPKELVARIKNLIEVRRKLRERFAVSIPLKPGEIAVTSLDNGFLRRAKEVVESKMAEETFTVEEFASLMCLSRVQLHRKITALTNLAASDFIRYLRLQRGMDLLKNNAGTVSEIAYQVGFSDPSHFSKSFHKQFGMAPSEVLKPHNAG
jgi:DNA-binding response OmpR family regulator